MDTTDTKPQPGRVRSGTTRRPRTATIHVRYTAEGLGRAATILALEDAINRLGGLSAGNTEGVLTIRGAEVFSAD